ncbi:MAG: class I SAM-dependent methyltransferase [Ilumatobacter sp.]|uniref:class I SAM-dependent methyltransferase n=1 Tax=Ilumatobacter sp. TaxID=1967498 RepID=UPI0026083C4A|nr:class I SAM-dependent methyltransferase [Ilumatobacter sp.]MDJ0769907.1 class I SAM-dependent methyltransferase [Ilumatobacter sp.]
MPGTSVSYARIADRYEHARGGTERADALVEAIGPWLTDGLICDVGAGTGVVTERLRTAGRDVLAVDLSIEMLRRAAERLPGRVAVADGSHLPLADGTVDMITFVWVLHHVADLDATLREARRVLRRGGRIVTVSGLSIPTADEMSPVFERLNDRLRPDRVRQSLAVAEVAGSVGFTIAHEGTARTSAETSPNALADAIEERMFSHLWDLDEEQWRTIVAPAVDELRSLPEPDRARHRVFDHPLLVLDR